MKFDFQLPKYIRERFLENQYHFLVTGGAGFIGSHICEHLVRLFQKVTLLDNFHTGSKKNIESIYNYLSETNLPKNNFQVVRGDTRNPQICLETCKGVDFVLHQAALASVPMSIEDPQTTTDINISGTLNLLFSAKQHRVKRFIFASSSAVYGDSKSLIKKEDQEEMPSSPYGISKWCNEKHAFCFQSLFGLEVIGLRYFNVFGPRQHANSAYAAAIPIFIKTLLKKSPPIIYGDGSNTRDFIYVDNVVLANLCSVVADKAATSKTYNIACGEKKSVLDTVKLISDILRTYIDPIFVDPRPGDIRHSSADISQAISLLHYSPVVDFKSGLEKTISWYKANN